MEVPPMEVLMRETGRCNEPASANAWSAHGERVPAAAEGVSTAAKPVTAAEGVSTAAKPVTATAEGVSTAAKPVTATAKPVSATAAPRISRDGEA
jgi:hypothetical protein